MVHLKTQQAYAKNENDLSVEKKIAEWFSRFENALKVLLSDDSIRLIYDYKNYNFLIEQKGRNPYSLDELSDGYSAIIGIVADLILRMDRNWLLKGELSQYDVEGIVLIDELETHLHVELQRKILPFLTEFFPRIQFIITTHSAYILNSISNACIYDLEKQVRLQIFLPIPLMILQKAIWMQQLFLMSYKRKQSDIRSFMGGRTFPMTNAQNAQTYEWN